MIDPEEPVQIEQAVVQQFASCVDAQKQAAFHQALLASGLVKTIKTPPADMPECAAVPILGKPLSETIMEERR